MKQSVEEAAKEYVDKYKQFLMDNLKGPVNEIVASAFMDGAEWQRNNLNIEPKQPFWILPEEELPEIGKPVLAYVRGSYDDDVYMAYYDESSKKGRVYGEWHYMYINSKINHKVLGWFPLPEFK